MASTRVTFRDLQADVELMNTRLESVGSAFRVVANAGQKSRYITVENTNPDAYVKTTILCSGTAKACIEQGWHWVSMQSCDALYAQNIKLIAKLVEQEKIISRLEHENLGLRWDIKNTEDADSVDY